MGSIKNLSGIKGALKPFKEFNFINYFICKENDILSPEGE